jgi:hypothetical protein
MSLQSTIDQRGQAVGDDRAGFAPRVSVWVLCICLAGILLQKHGLQNGGTGRCILGTSRLAAGSGSGQVPPPMAHHHGGCQGGDGYTSNKCTTLHCLGQSRRKAAVIGATPTVTRQMQPPWSEAFTQPAALPKQDKTETTDLVSRPFLFFRHGMQCIRSRQHAWPGRPSRCRHDRIWTWNNVERLISTSCTGEDRGNPEGTAPPLHASSWKMAFGIPETPSERPGPTQALASHRTSFSCCMQHGLFGVGVAGPAFSLIFCVSGSLSLPAGRTVPILGSDAGAAGSGTVAGAHVSRVMTGRRQADGGRDYVLRAVREDRAAVCGLPPAL